MAIISVNGERIQDEATAPWFQSNSKTHTELYDLYQNLAHQTFIPAPSSTDGQLVPTSVLMTGILEEVERRWKSEKFHADATFGAT